MIGSDELTTLLFHFRCLEDSSVRLCGALWSLSRFLYEPATCSLSCVVDLRTWIYSPADKNKAQFRLMKRECTLTPMDIFASCIFDLQRHRLCRDALLNFVVCCARKLHGIRPRSGPENFKILYIVC